MMHDPSVSQRATEREFSPGFVAPSLLEDEERGLYTVLDTEINGKPTG